MRMKGESEVTQSCPTLSDPMSCVSDPMSCSLPGSSVHGIFQGRVLEWGAIAFSQFISRNPLMIFFFCKRGWKSHFKQNQVGKQLQISMKKSYKNFRYFDSFSYNNKVFLPFKKIFTKLKHMFSMSCTDKGNILLKILNRPLPFFCQACLVSCNPKCKH